MDSAPHILPCVLSESFQACDDFSVQNPCRAARQSRCGRCRRQVLVRFDRGNRGQPACCPTGQRCSQGFAGERFGQVIVHSGCDLRSRAELRADAVTPTIGVCRAAPSLRLISRVAWF